MKLSLTSSAVSCYLRRGMDPKEVFRTFRATGFRCVDFEITADMMGDDPVKAGAFWRDLLDSCDLTVTQTHAPMPNPFRDEASFAPAKASAENALRFCRGAGFSNTVVHPGARNGNTREEFIENNVAFYRSLIPVAEETGVTILIENIGHYMDPYFLWSAADLVELIERIRKPSAAILALTMEAFAIEDAPEESAGVVIPAAMAFIGLSFIACALIIAGLPPLSGFLAKFALFHALLNPAGAITDTLYYAGPLAWSILALVIVSGLSAIISLMRFGVRAFWAAPDAKAPRLQLSEAAPISALLLLCITISVAAGPTMSYMDRTSNALHEPQGYIERVLNTPAVPGVVGTAGDEP